MHWFRKVYSKRALRQLVPLQSLKKFLYAKEDTNYCRYRILHATANSSREDWGAAERGKER